MPNGDVRPIEDIHAGKPLKSAAHEAQKKTKKRKRKVNPVKRTFAVIGATFLSLTLIVIITGCIIAAALTVYVMQYTQDVGDVINPMSHDYNIGYTTFIYGYDEMGNQVELQSISRKADRIWVAIDQVPQHVRDAFVYTEDERFYEHDGVDWKRTFGAFINEFAHMWSGRQGGSTITQQLIKNISGEDETTWDRKMREIMMASQMEKHYTKTDILESYLNYIGFGGTAHGIQAASLRYFGKDVSELSIAEGACLAAIPKSPNQYNPLAYYIDEQTGEVVNYGAELNKERRDTVLAMMYKNASISKKQYEDALEEELKFVDPSAKNEDGSVSYGKIQNWFVDDVINDVINDFVSIYGITYQEASDKLYNEGYEIYTTIDINMQEEIEAKYKDYTNFSDKVLSDPPESAFIVMDYMGNVKAVVGKLGEKPMSNIFNRASMARRPVGSCIKPIAGYSYAIENDLIHWSSVLANKPLDIPDPDNPGRTIQWPHNYNSLTWDYGGYFTFQALQRSLNTISARLIEMATPQEVYNFMQNKFRLNALSPYDADLSPLATGSLTDGLTLRELTATYQVFGNGGVYYPPTTYTKVLDSTGKTVIQHNYTPIQTLSEDSAYIMNKLMQTVIEGPNGTGRAAKLPTVPLIGKTGTAQDWHDLLFVGCTPDYVAGVWYGHDTPKEIPTGTYFSSPQVWKNVFGDIAEQRAIKRSFPECEEVEEIYYCTKTGLRASGTCPTAEVGYYKPSNIPPYCSGNHGSEEG